jgi:predicted pyridoxine 5'-phosphate oxidase superfamily flavin-nucleotide-binding protein
MIKMTSLMRDLLSTAHDEKVPCLVATASKDGVPQLSPRGSMAVYDDETLSFWEYSLKKTYQNIQENPQVAVYYRNVARAKEIPYHGAAIRFYGAARIYANGPERERAWELTVPLEKEKDPEKIGVGVLIRVGSRTSKGRTSLVREESRSPCTARMKAAHRRGWDASYPAPPRSRVGSRRGPRFE